MKRLGHGQVWWADLGNVRPIVVLTRASVAGRLQRIVVAPVTTTVLFATTRHRASVPAGLRSRSTSRNRWYEPSRLCRW